MHVYPFPAEISKHKLNMSYLHHGERFREKNSFLHLEWRVFSRPDLCPVQCSEASARLGSLGFSYSSPAGGGGSHSLYSLEEA